VGCTAANHFWDGAAGGGKASTAVNNDKATVCCSARAKCTTYTCPVGKKHVTAHDTTFCTSGTCVTPTEEGTCCQDDTSVCAGNTQVGCTAANHFWDGAAGGGKASTSVNNDKATVCCSAKQVCSAFSCPAGKKAKTNAATIHCTGAPGGTCDEGQCCDADVLTCGGLPDTCLTGYYYSSGSASIAATAATYPYKCCTAKSLCSTFTCADGTRVKDTTCSAADGVCNEAVCCENNPMSCGNTVAVACTTNNYFWDSSKGSTVITTGKGVDCCSAQPKCDSYTCPTGKKPINNAATTYCLTGTCQENDCCQADTSVCAGNTQVGCTAANHFWDGAAGGGKASTAVNNDKATVCCSARAKCTTYTCPVGKKHVTAHDTTFCTSGTCVTPTEEGTCCQDDTSVCAGNTQVGCTAANHFWDGAAGGGKASTSVNNDKATVCCSAKQVCSAFSCPAGKKAKTNAATIHCTGAPGGTCDEGQCCDADVLTCGGLTISCLPPLYYDSANDGRAATADNKNSVCCTFRDTCEAQFNSGSGSGSGSGGSTGSGGGAGSGSGGSGTASGVFKVQLDTSIGSLLFMLVVLCIG